MDVIIGGGISGLSYAAFTPHDYLLLEKEDELGGYCRTIYQDGFTWDYSGHFFHFQNQWVRDFAMKFVESEILDVKKRTQIFYNGKYVDYPFQKNIHQLNKQELIECLYDLFNNPHSTCSTFKQMLYAKFGKSIAEKFLIPYNEKLYATDLDLLDVDAMGRFFPYADKEEIIRNFKSGEEISYNGSFQYPRGGAMEYVRSLAHRLDGSCISLNESVASIDLKCKTVVTDKRNIHFDRLISTMPLPQLLRYCGLNYNPQVYSCNQVLVFNIGFNKGNPLQKNHWVYFPDKNLIFYRIGFYNNIFDEENLSLYVEIGLPHGTDPDKDSYLKRTLNDMRKIGIISDHEVKSYNAVIMDPAYVHVSKSMETVRAQDKSILAQNDVYSIGRYGNWCYCSIEDNILEAKEIAEKLA